MSAIDQVCELQDQVRELKAALERITKTDGSSIARDIARAALSDTITGKLHR
jgi:hypothetical protein